jgi:hypothetical protein
MQTCWTLHMPRAVVIISERREKQLQSPTQVLTTAADAASNQMQSIASRRPCPSWLLKPQTCVSCLIASAQTFDPSRRCATVRSNVREHIASMERCYNLQCRVKEELRYVFDSSISRLCYRKQLSAIYSSIQLPCLYVNK